jgi:sodium pump decarboxylase gamma subunit
MNRKLKSLLAMVCVLALTLAMSVCAFAADTVTEDEVANYKSAAETLISQIAGFSDEEIENYLAQDDAFTTATMESWKSVKDELGAYSSIVSQDVEKDGDVVTISTVAQFEKAKADVVLMLDLGQQMYTSMTYSVQYSLAANMQRAGMNTLMGIGIVFLMLLFLSFVIGLFKYIEKFQNVGKKKAAEEAPKAEEAPAPAIAQSEAADEDFADDLELVAVISAAIAAYENTSGDSFVVRSIKKSNKWHRA